MKKNNLKQVPLRHVLDVAGGATRQATEAASLRARRVKVLGQPSAMKSASSRLEIFAAALPRGVHTLLQILLQTAATTRYDLASRVTTWAQRSQVPTSLPPEVEQIGQSFE